MDKRFFMDNRFSWIGDFAWLRDFPGSEIFLWIRDFSWIRDDSKVILAIFQGLRPTNPAGRGKHYRFARQTLSSVSTSDY